MKLAQWEWCHCELAIWISTIVAVLAILVGLCFLARSCKARTNALSVTHTTTDSVELESTASIEEGKFVEEKKVEESSDNGSTVTPASDKQSEPSICGDADAKDDNQGSTPVLAVVKALSEQSI